MSFVPHKIQDELLKNGWVKIYDSLDEVNNYKLYPSGYRGMQMWKRDRYELSISYECNGKHEFSVQLNEDFVVDGMKLRNIISTLKRRDLL